MEVLTLTKNNQTHKLLTPQNLLEKENVLRIDTINTLHITIIIILIGTDVHVVHPVQVNHIPLDLIHLHLDTADETLGEDILLQDRLDPTAVHIHLVLHHAHALVLGHTLDHILLMERGEDIHIFLMINGGNFNPFNILFQY